MKYDKPLSRKGILLTDAFDVFASIAIPFIAALTSLLGVVFAEANQRKRIKYDVDILNALDNNKHPDRATSDYKKELSEHIAREISMLIGGKARWTCLPRSVTFLTISCILFSTMGRLVQNLNFENQWMPTFVFLYFMLLVASVASLTTGLRSAYRYISLRSYLNYVVESERSASLALEKLNASLEKIVKSLHELTGIFNNVAISLEEFKPSIETIPPKYILTDIDETISNLKGFGTLLRDKMEELDAGDDAILALQDLPSRIMEDVRYVEERTLFSFSLSKEKEILSMQKSRMSEMRGLIDKGRCNIKRCQKIVEDSIELYDNIKASGVFDGQVVLQDDNSGLTFVTSKNIYDALKLNDIFNRISGDEFSIFKTSETCNTLVLGKKNGPETYQVVGFLSSKENQFPQYLRIIESPLSHT